MIPPPLFLLLSFLTLFTSTLLAIPTKSRQRDTAAQSLLAAMQPPLSNGSASLPPPTTPLKLLTMGIGTQNYTCTANSTAPPLLGAKATLFNLTPFLPWLAPYLPLLPPHALDIPISKIENVIPAAGYHIFNAQGVPTFDLGGVGMLAGKKAVGGDIVAPIGAAAAAGAEQQQQQRQDQGSTQPAQGKPVNWLKLCDQGGSWGVSTVYRVDTAAGTVGTACQGKEAGEEVNVGYAALYYFYE